MPRARQLVSVPVIQVVQREIVPVLSRSKRALVECRGRSRLRRGRTVSRQRGSLATPPSFDIVAERHCLPAQMPLQLRSPCQD